MKWVKIEQEKDGYAASGRTVDGKFQRNQVGRASPSTNLIGSILAVKDLREKSSPNISFWSCWESRVFSGRCHSRYRRHTPFLLKTYIMYVLFPRRPVPVPAGANGDGFTSADPPKNCILQSLRAGSPKREISRICRKNSHSEGGENLVNSLFQIYPLFL